MCFEESMPGDWSEEDAERRERKNEYLSYLLRRSRRESKLDDER